MVNRIITLILGPVETCAQFAGQTPNAAACAKEAQTVKGPSNVYSDGGGRTYSHSKSVAGLGRDIEELKK